MATYYYYADASGANDGTSEADAWTDFENALESIGAGDTLYMKKSASRVTGMGTIDASMATPDETKMTNIEGYETTIGDGGMWQGDAKLKFETAGGYGGNIVVQNMDLELSSTSYVCVLDSTMGHCHFYNCKFKNTKTDGSNDSAFDALHTATFTNCSFESESPTMTTRGAVYIAAWDSGSFFNCSFRGKIGVYSSHTGASNLTFQSCIFTDATSQTMDTAMTVDLAAVAVEARGFFVTGCTFYDFDTDAIVIRDIEDLSGNNFQCNMHIHNNIFYGNSATNAVSITDASQTVGFLLSSNAYGGVTNQVNGEGTNSPNLGAVALSSDPFTDGANLDFTLNDTADGGALCKGTAYPTSMNGVSYTEERNIGASQYTAEGGESISIF